MSKCLRPKYNFNYDLVATVFLSRCLSLFNTGSLYLENNGRYWNRYIAPP